jgi:hypothetical protein
MNSAKVKPLFSSPLTLFGVFLLSSFTPPPPPCSTNLTETKDFLFSGHPALSMKAPSDPEVFGLPINQPPLRSIFSMISVLTGNVRRIGGKIE